MTSITLRILQALKDNGRIEGTEKLAEIIGTDPKYIVPHAMQLHRLGLINMVIRPSGGRGNKSIYEMTYQDAGTLTVINTGRHS